MIEGKIKLGDWFVYKDKYDNSEEVYVLAKGDEDHIALISIKHGGRWWYQHKIKSISHITLEEFTEACGHSLHLFRRYRPEDQKLLKDKLGEISMSKFKEGDKVNPINFIKYFGVKDGDYDLQRCSGDVWVVNISCRLPHTGSGIACPVLVTDNDGGYWFFPEEHLELAEKRIKINFEGTEEEAVRKFGPGIVNALTE